MFNNLRDEELNDLFLYHSGGACWGHNIIHEGLGSRVEIVWYTPQLGRDREQSKTIERQ